MQEPRFLSPCPPCWIFVELEMFAVLFSVPLLSMPSSILAIFNEIFVYEKSKINFKWHVMCNQFLSFDNLKFYFQILSFLFFKEVAQFSKRVRHYLLSHLAGGKDQSAWWVSQREDSHATARFTDLSRTTARCKVNKVSPLAAVLSEG